MFDPYQVLGVAREVSQEELKLAYRRAANRVHPDREGGTLEAMQELNRAWDLLGDPARRAAFDRDGNVSRQNPIEIKARDLILQKVSIIIRAAPIEGEFIPLIRRSLLENRRNLIAQREKTQAEIGGLKRRLKRFVGPPGNFIEGCILAEVAKGEKLFEVYDADELVIVKALEMIGAFSDVEDPFPRPDLTLLGSGLNQIFRP